MESVVTVNDFSKHLFWDVDLSQFNLEQYAGFMVQRVLEYGKLEDWKLLKKYYGDQRILDEAIRLRSLNPISVSFLATTYGIDETNFRCYKSTPSARHSLNY